MNNNNTLNLIGISGKIGSGKDTVGKIIQYFTWLSKHNIKIEELNEKQSCIYYLKKGCIQGWGDISGNKRWATSDWEIKKFAGKPKQIASMVTGIPVEKFEDQEFKDTYLEKKWNIREETMPCHCDTIMDWYHEDRKCVNCGQTTKVKYTAITVREFLQKLGTEAMRNGLHENIWVNALFADYKPNCDKFNSKFKQSFNYECSICNNCNCFPNWIITDVRFPNEFKAIKDRNGIVIRVCNGQKKSKDNHTSETALDLGFTFDYTIYNSGTIEELVEKVKLMLIHFNLIK